MFLLLLTVLCLLTEESRALSVGRNERETRMKVKTNVKAGAIDVSVKAS